MFRTHTCGELRLEDKNKKVILSGWVQKIRDKGGLIWIDLRDRYGITQLLIEDGRSNSIVIDAVRKLGREYVIQAKGTVIERLSKNPNIPTGNIEIDLSEIQILNSSLTPPFTIEDETDGGEELRMKYRYLDLRRQPLRSNLELRNRLSIETRKYLDSQNFFEIETPYLIKSTPEGARDFVVPSRMNEGQFYALPQSPQTFKQLLMVAGYDRYYQLVKCFRDEDLRADRQPEFTQIDCEMAFVDQDDVLKTFEGMVKHLFKTVKEIELSDFPRMEYSDAMRLYGSDKPDIRFDMKFVELNDVAQNKGFKVFDDAELVVGIVAKECADYTRKQLDKLTEFVRRPQIGAKGLVYVKCNEDGTYKSSVDKFFDQDSLNKWATKTNAKKGDLILVLSGEKDKVRKQLNELRLEMGTQLNLRNPNNFAPLWVVDFPLLEWDEDSERFHAMHHPFTSPKHEDINLLDSNPGDVRANAYDLVINGSEIGGGSIRIHDRDLQKLMFKHLGFSDEEAQEQFGFLLNAFEYGAPPHGGIALGFDRLTALFGGQDSIRDFIAFPKNNSGRDMMIDSPSSIAEDQLDELGLGLIPKD
ncbi:MAG: aspartate--tRNA ligase [Lentimicrobiaceae bacterium]|jgi:aspartyl-tRNA synthetase|nr:aspartate--tRNA ligase [Lentimicrobiaceae bacterium]MBT3454533.1 aspartate--tRNA ligase [Lentimicrobiaceae bacterium]MBT3818127.1 aspartate--tRNA ligase [Lentimicrobiaceae bacterium]MBT4061454.1 aspartate--tRNA ligase [Lentimicrobiaceae bacterium]MBT4191168.1 aspartate--tRNA ligase [Lentimicrobiaceae bacterium]